MATLQVDDLRTYFHTRNGVVRAVDGVSFEVHPRETVGIVGESGSGKSVTCYSLLGLIPQPPGKIESGSAVFDGVDLLKCGGSQLRDIRGKRVSMIFQDPMTCLNPYMRVGDQLIEPLLIHSDISREEALKKAESSLTDVGILDARKRLQHYPHQFSGGMRQRVMIAMALITEPELLIADEPTTALDVTVQAQILDLIKKMQKRKSMAVIFITHDLGVIAGQADRILVMYAGRIVEKGTASDVFYRPQHPYTRALLGSIPATHEVAFEDGAEKEPLYTIPGLPPDLSKRIDGCAFAERCEHAESVCRGSDPQLLSREKGQYTACLRVQQGSLK